MAKFDFAMAVLRLSFGLSMAFHGVNKIRNNGLSGTTSWFHSLGMKWPRMQAISASVVEMISGILLAIGLLTSLSCSLFVAIMIVAIWAVHWKVGYFIFLPNGGWEYCASIIMVATSISLLGPGKFSIDHLLNVSSSWGLWATPIGIVAALCHLALFYRPQKSGESS